MVNNYSVKEYNKENMARTYGRALPISFKQSVEICNFIRNKKVKYVKDVLNKVINQEQVIPFRRFNTNMGHKKKIMAGRYPKKASMEILKLINGVEANAQFKGMNTANLAITHINANKASKVMHFGRRRSRWAKRTNVEIVIQEAAEKKTGKEKTEVKKVKSENKKAKENEKIQKKEFSGVHKKLMNK